MQKKLWYLIEEIPEYPVHIFQVLFVMAQRLQTLGFGHMPKYFQHFVQGGGPLYAEARVWDRAVQQTMRVLIDNPEKYLARIGPYQRKIGRMLDRTAGRILATELRRLTNKELLKLFNNVLHETLEIHFTRGPGWIVEQRDEAFTKYLLVELAEFIHRKKLTINSAEVLSILTMPSEPMQTAKEEIDLLRLAARTRLASTQALQAHLKKYWYLTYGTVGPGTNLAELRRRFLKLRRGNPHAEIIRITKQRSALVKEQKRLIKLIRPTRRLMNQIRAAQLIALGKAWTKEIQYHGHAARDRVSLELGRRFGINIRRFNWMFPVEVEHLVTTGRRPSNDVLDQRWKNSFLMITDRSWGFLNKRERTEFFLNNELESVSAVDVEIREFTGTPAVLGYAKGQVKIINTIQEMSKMKKGDILVSNMTIPEIVPAMRRAVAIVTNVGGLTCHAAIVSRELHIPCVIGTKIATKVLKDGDLVEVDATKGIVRKM